MVAEVRGMHVKLGKIEGEFVWHAYADEDELFMVLSGELTMELRDRAPIILAAGRGPGRASRSRAPASGPRGGPYHDVRTQVQGEYGDG